MPCDLSQFMHLCCSSFNKVSIRGKLKVRVRIAGKCFGGKLKKNSKFFSMPPLFCRAPQFGGGGTAHARVGTKLGSHSPLFIRKEMACS